MSPPSRPIRLLATAIAIGFAWGLAPEPARAGPTSYDKETRSFRLTYTFADLPGAGVGDFGGNYVAASVKPTPDQETLFKSLAAQVSDVLFKATEGRARISRLDYVDDIKNADIVISRTGAPLSAGWANRGCINNKPGYVVLYYQTLLPYIRQDVVYAGAHELSHYIFNVVDEYSPNASNPCPLPGTGPGCLMDNYYSSARGYMGRYCNRGEHHSSADQVQSCQEIVDKFFDDLGVTKQDPGATGVNVGTIAGGSDSGATSLDPRKDLVSTAIGKVKARYLEGLARKKPGASGGTSTSGLRSFAKQFFTNLVADFNRNSTNKAIFPPDKLSQAIDLIVKASAFIPVLKPIGIADTVFNMIKAEAQAVGDQVKTEKSEGTRVSKIRSHLTKFVAELARNNVLGAPDNPKDLKDQQKALKDLIDRLARDEGRSEADKKLDRLVSLGDVNARMQREVATYIVDILDELDAPGIPARRDVLRRFDQELAKLSIPGRTASTFGRRRTRFINPDPPGDTFDYVLTQGGVFPYVAIRDRGFRQFASLIDRARIELVEPRFQPETFAAGGLPLQVRIDRPFAAARVSNEDRINEQRNTNFQALLNDLFDQIQRDRLENIAILVPPGGLPPGIEQSLEVLNARLTPGVDVRLDLVLVGAGDIPTRLRDLSARSGGSVLTITDLDEIGAIAQRLKNEETSGSWLIIPQQGTIPPGHSPPTKDRLAALVKDAQDRLKAIKDPLGTAARDLADLLKAQDMTAAVRGRVDQATNGVQILLQLLDGMDLGKLGVKAPAASRGAYQGPNQRMLEQIAAVKEQVEALKKLVAESSSLSNSNAAAKKLTTLIASIESGPIGEKLIALDRLVRAYELALESALDASGDSLPIYHRVNRQRLEAARQTIEARGNPSEPKLAAKAQDFAKSGLVRLARFYAESRAVTAEADLELIVGLSRPLPDVDLARAAPQLELCDDAGMTIETTGATRDGGAGRLVFDWGKSTDTLLVYRVEYPRELEEGAYTPFLTLDPATVAHLEDNDVNFTFSVGSTRHNVQLLANMVDDTSDGTRGTLRSPEGRAVVEVHVSAGSAVLGAQVVGFCQKITVGSATISGEKVTFLDQGQQVRPASGDRPALFDKVAGDGIYTASIPIDGIAEDTEFRVFIQADTTDGQATYIPLDDPNREDPAKNSPAIRDDKAKADAAASQKKAEGPALKFQRATSVHFRVTK